MPGTSCLFPLAESTEYKNFGEQWTDVQLSFSIHHQSLGAFDHICSSPNVEEMLSSPTAFRRWMQLSSNYAFRLDYTAAINLFFGKFATTSIVSGELHIHEGLCPMVADCTIRVTEPLHTHGAQDANKKVDPEVRVFLKNFRAAGSAIKDELESCKLDHIARSAGTPRFALSGALPSMKASVDQPTQRAQSRISL